MSEDDSATPVPDPENGRSPAAAGDSPAPTRRDPERLSVAEPAEGVAPPAGLADEHVLRGSLLSLLIIPAGIAGWVLLWQWGFVSAIVAFGVVWGALFLYILGSGLYRLGPGTVISRAGFWVIMSVTVVTLVLSFLAGLAWDLATAIEAPMPAAFYMAEFWAIYREMLGDPEVWSAYFPSIVFSLLFGALGAFSVLRALAKQSSGKSELA
ncbi:hypothetical protein [Agromyces sp. NPDC057865]|uniref:hypothetical protein n=1 Tax=Agromyces sp. NPDC057865 TaxID=3346267 RepID=UPI00366BF6E2